MMPVGCAAMMPVGLGQGELGRRDAEGRVKKLKSESLSCNSYFVTRNSYSYPYSVSDFGAESEE